MTKIRKISEYRMPCKSVWSLSIFFIRTGIYLNKRRRIEEQGTLRFTLVKVADYKMWKKSFRAGNVLNPCDENSSRLPMQELEANIMRKMLRWFSEYNQQDATFLNLFISVRRSTCFRRFFRP